MADRTSTGQATQDVDMLLRAAALLFGRAALPAQPRWRAHCIKCGLSLEENESTQAIEAATGATRILSNP